jgi:hypothetical protein
MNHAQQQIEDARRTLYNLNPVDGSITSKSKLYKMFEEKARDYAKAKSDYALAMEKARSDPATAGSWPLMAAPYQEVVDTAYDTWMSAGKENIERAIGIVGSVTQKFQ